MKISQSFINDALGAAETDPASCPKYLNFKYVQNLDIDCSDAMMAGRYFEWHLLGATRDGIEPILPRVGVKDLRPKKSSTKKAKVDYLISKGVVIGEKETDESLFLKCCDLPEDWSAGEPNKAQETLDQIISIARQVLLLMGLDTAEGEKQVRLETDELVGHLDWITKDFQRPERMALYDVKWTETKVDDRWNGWGEFDNKLQAKTQATQYTRLYHAVHGVWVPFYFLIFGKAGWIRVLKITVTEGGVATHEFQVEATKGKLQQFKRTKWKALPEFNKCINCPYTALCPERSVVPTVETFEV